MTLCTSTRSPRTKLACLSQALVGVCEAFTAIESHPPTTDALLQGFKSDITHSQDQPLSLVKNIMNVILQNIFIIEGSSIFRHDNSIRCIFITQSVPSHTYKQFHRKTDGSLGEEWGFILQRFSCVYSPCQGGYVIILSIIHNLFTL